MTISSTLRLAGPYIGTGLVSIYPFGFKVFQASDILVLQTDTSGNITTLVLTSNYSVALNPNQDTNPGGSITLTTGILAEEPIRTGVQASTFNAAIDAFVRAAALEMPRGIRINAVSPGVLVESMPTHAPPPRNRWRS